MCDTFVAPSPEGGIILAKNSDREPNEAQAILRLPARKWRERWLKCTFIRIPQVERTYGVILSKPFQMWGAEMGVNEHGLAIGNEAVFTRVRFARRNDGLTGMDLVRLALERCRTAEEAVDGITALLERYGQNACGGYRDERFFYHNSYLLADPEEAWLLETAGRHWAASRVNGSASISNGLTIEKDYDRIGKDTVDFARRNSWSAKGATFNFRKAYSDRLYTWLSRSRYRRRQTGAACAAGNVSAARAMNILQTHHPQGPSFTPQKATAASVCMHPNGLFNPSQTNGSMVAQLRPMGASTVWLTGTSLPCLSIYMPFFFGSETPLPKSLTMPGPVADRSLWWRAERIHRRICRNYREGRQIIEAERRELQKTILEKALPLSKEPGESVSAGQKDGITGWSVQEYLNCLDEWQKALGKAHFGNRHLMYSLFWRKRNRRAGLTD